MCEAGRTGSIAKYLQTSVNTENMWGPYHTFCVHKETLKLRWWRVQDMDFSDYMLILLVLRNVRSKNILIHTVWPIPTFGGYSNTVDFGLLYKQVHRKGKRKEKKKREENQRQGTYTKPHSQCQQHLRKNPGLQQNTLASSSLSAIICWAQWLQHKTQLGERAHGTD